MAGERYILDDEGNPVACEDLERWALWMVDGDRQVARDEVGEALVSTVFLGLDHRFGGDGPPILWETMVFGDPLDGEQWRYSSKAAAIAGHVEAVTQVFKAAARLSHDHVAGCPGSQAGD